MQDEINEKVVALSVKGAKLTAEMLQKAIKAMLAQAKKQQEKQPHGKQTLKQLAKQNAGLSNIEIWLAFFLLSRFTPSFRKVIDFIELQELAPDSRNDRNAHRIACHLI